jgi:CO/xanthine dehydrogenase FAD-binding subunit
MITMYHRPQTLDEALTLLAQPNTVPLGGGTLLSHASTSLSATNPVSVVDLQALGLDSINKKGNQDRLSRLVRPLRFNSSLRVKIVLKH